MTGLAELISLSSCYLPSKGRRQRVLPSVVEDTSLSISQARSLEKKIDALRRAGLVQWSGKKLRPRQPVAKVRGDKTIAEIIIEDRR